MPRPTPPLVLRRPVVVRAAGRLDVRCALGPDRELWLALEGDERLVSRSVPGLEPLLPVAMMIAAREGRDLEVEGPIDPVHLARLRVGLPPLLHLAYGIRPGRVRVRQPWLGHRTRRATALPPPAAPDSVALPFSSGVDSFYSLGRVGASGLRLACLVNVNAGAHGSDRRLFAARRARVASVAAAVGVPLLAVDSNLHELLAMDHARIHTLRNLAALGVLRGVVGAVIYSSSYHHRMIDVRRLDEGLHYGGPAAAGAVAWSALPVVEVGYERSRPDKSADIAAMPLARSHLDLCINSAYQIAAGPADPINCGSCWKCVKALLTFDHMGVLDAFEAVIPTAAYRADPEGHLASLDGRSGAGTVEIRELEARGRRVRGASVA